MPFNPCGFGVAYIREEGTDTIRPFADSDLEVTRRWYRAAPDAPKLPFADVFRPTNWMPFPYLKSGAGSVWPAGWRFKRVGVIGGFDYSHFCGTESDFAGHALFDPTVNVLYDADWIPECCGREDVCTFNLCATEPENGRPASQFLTYPIPHQDATGATPVLIEHNGLNLGNHSPAWPGIGWEWKPAGADGDAARQFQLIADDAGQLQFQTDVWRFGAVDSIARTINATGYGLDFDLAGDVGGFAWEFVDGVLTLTGTNIQFDAAAFGLGTAAFEDMGFEGHTVPFLDGVNFWAARQFYQESTGHTNDLNQIASWVVTSTGTEAAGFGGSHGYYLGIPGGGTLPAGQFSWEWVDPVAQLGVARLKWLVRGDSQEREVIRADCAVNVERLGFFGVNAVPRQSGDVASALVALGLMSSASYTQPAALADLVALAAGDDLVVGDGAGGFSPVTLGAGLSLAGTTLSATSPTATNGQEPVSTFTLTGGAGVRQEVGVAIVLPAAGTYLIVGRVDGEVQPSAPGAASIWAVLRDGDGDDVTGSLTCVVGTTDDSAITAGSGSFNLIRTVGAATTFQLAVFRNGSGWTTSRVATVSGDSSIVDWVRIA